MNRSTIKEPTHPRCLSARIKVIVQLDLDVVPPLMTIKQPFQSSARTGVITENEIGEEPLASSFEKCSVDPFSVNKDLGRSSAICKTDDLAVDAVIDFVLESWSAPVKVYKTKDVHDCFDQIRFTRTILPNDDGC